MRIIIPILLITLLGFIACQDDPKVEPSKANPAEVSTSFNADAVNRESGTSESTSFFEPKEEQPEKPSSDLKKPAQSPEETKAAPTILSTSQLAQKFAKTRVETQNPVPQPPMTPEDSVKLWETDDLVTFAQKQRNKTLSRKDLQLNFFTEEDHFFYTSQDNKVIEAVISSKGETSNRRFYYYFNEDGSIAFYRDLEWKPLDIPPFSMETIVFIDNNKIYNVERRRIDLPVGEGPNRLLTKPFERVEADRDALLQEILGLWKILFNEIENNEMGINDEG